MDYVAAVRRDAAAILELCGRDLAREITSCQGWTAADLQEHILDTFRGEIPGFGEDQLPPDDALRRALDLLEHQGTAARDVALECAVHRWDASAAFETDYVIDAELACDGIDEFFEVAWPLWLDAYERPAGTGERLRLQRSDGPERWHVVLDERPVVTHGVQSGDVEVRGTASDLLLWLWGRMDPPHVDGDRSVLEQIKNPAGRFLSPGF